MAVAIVDPPRVRPAGSLDLFAEDLAALRAFRCFSGAGTWYERDAERVLRRARKRYAERDLGERERILLYERDGELMAVAIFGEESESTAHVGFVGIKPELHRARIDSEDGDRLSDAVLTTCLISAEELGYRRATAQVAHEHAVATDLLRRANFELLSRYDHDYDVYAVGLA